MNKIFKRLSKLLAGFVIMAAFSCPCAMSGQLYAGSISGVIKDPSGALVPHAAVTVTDTLKGFTYKTTSDASGFYAIRSLAPSTYSETIQVAGFAPYKQEGLILPVNGNLTADASLALAGASQRITVTQASTPLLQTEDATTGQAVNLNFIENLPLVQRNVMNLAFLAPGVAQSPGTAYGVSPPGGGHMDTNFVTEGSRNAQADILLDGVSIMNGESNTGIVKALYVPPVEALQEFSVLETNFSAEYGNSGGVIINAVTKSGTNHFHGELFEFFRNNDLNANNFFANRAGIGQAHSEGNDFGGTLGGPLLHNRLFFFVDYDGIRTLTGATATYGVPSTAERAGNFGELCGYAGGTFDASGICSNSAGQIFDPMTGTYSASNGGAVGRTPIPFNDLATYVSPGNPLSPNNVGSSGQGNLIDPVAMKLINAFPLPNYTGPGGYNPYANAVLNSASTNDQNSFDVKLDSRLGETQTLDFRFSRSEYNYLGTDFFKNVYDSSSQGPQVDSAYLGALSYTKTFNPKTVFTASAGYGYDYEASKGIGARFPGFSQVTTLGMPAYMADAGYLLPPSVNLFSAYAQGADINGTIGAQGWSIQNYGAEQAHLIAALDHTFSNHEIKVGSEWRLHQVNYAQPEYPSGVFSMDANGTAQNSSGVGGDAMATLLVGYVDNPTFNSYEIPPSVASTSLQFGEFVQDNWHVSKNLTLNVGLRYDVERPKTVRHNRSNWFDPNVASPISGYRGAIEYAGVDGNPRPAFNTYWKEIQPRFGFAYRIGEFNSVRGGYGIYFDPSDMAAGGIQLGGVQGYQGLTNGPVNLPSDPAVPVAFLRNPFPYGIVQPTGNSKGTAEAIGDAVNAPIRTWNQPPMEQSWSLGIEHEFPHQMLAEAEYIGRRGTHLYMQNNVNIDIVPQQVADAYRAGQASTYNAQVNNPLYGNSLVDPTGSLAGPTVPDWQLTLPFPQYTSVNGSYRPIASSIYHGLTLKFQKRMSGGMQVLATYVFEKSLDNSSVNSSNYTWIEGGGQDVGPEDPYNLDLEWSESQFDVPQIFEFVYTWQLPFGRGRRFGAHLNRVLDFALGGWNLNGIYRWDDGEPIMLGYNAPTGTVIPTFNSPRPDLTGRLHVCGTKNLSQYFCNPQVVTPPAPFIDGNASRTLSYARVQGTDDLEASLVKSFPLYFRPGASLELGVESFNMLNRVQFGAPDTTLQPNTTGATSGGFGQITTQANSPRQVQIRAKINF